MRLKLKGKCFLVAGSDALEDFLGQTTDELFLAINIRVPGPARKHSPKMVPRFQNHHFGPVSRRRDGRHRAASSAAVNGNTTYSAEARSGARRESRAGIKGDR